MAVQISGNDITVPRDGTFSRNVSIAGTLTYEDVTNVDSIGLVTARNGIEVGASPGVAASISVDGNAIFSGITTIGGVVNANSDIKVGSGVTVGKDGDIFATGVCTATSFSGDGSSLTGIDADKISEGNTEAEVVDTGSDGHFKVTTEGTERIRVGPSGQIGIAGANYGTSGQVLSSQGSGSVIAWATPASGWVHAAEVSLNGNSSVTLTGVPDGASHIRYLIRYMSMSSSAQAMFRLEKSTTGGSKSILTSGYQTQSAYVGTSDNSGGDSNSTNMNIFKGWTDAAHNLFGSVDVYRIGTNGSDGTNYFLEHQGFRDGQAIFQANGYLELGTSSTDFISGAKFMNSNGVNFDNGYVNQSYLLS